MLLPGKDQHQPINRDDRHHHKSADCHYDSMAAIRLAAFFVYVGSNFT